MLPNVIAPNCHRQNTFIGLPPAHFYCPLDSIFPAQFRNNAPTHHFYETTKRFDGVIKCFDEPTKCFDGVIKCFDEPTKCFDGVKKCFEETKKLTIRA